MHARTWKVHEMIIISLFDEVEFDDRSSGGYLDDESAIRREKRFLGSVLLPFQVSQKTHNAGVNQFCAIAWKVNYTKAYHM